MSRLFKSAAREVRELFPVWLYFFLAFSLLRLTQSLVLRQYGIQITTPSLVLVGSLIVAKAFLILDLFGFVEKFNGKPLIFGVIWKTGIYYIGAFGIYFIEQLVEFAIKHHEFAAAWTHVTAALGTPRYWVLQIWLALLLLAYTAMRETIRALGKQRILALWFGAPSPQAGSPAGKAA